MACCILRPNSYMKTHLTEAGQVVSEMMIPPHIYQLGSTGVERPSRIRVVLGSIPGLAISFSPSRGLKLEHGLSPSLIPGTSWDHRSTTSSRCRSQTTRMMAPAGRESCASSPRTRLRWLYKTFSTCCCSPLKVVLSPRGSALHIAQVHASTHPPTEYCQNLDFPVNTSSSMPAARNRIFTLVAEFLALQAICQCPQ
jgi:hypothetical protein